MYILVKYVLIRSNVVLLLVIIITVRRVLQGCIGMAGNARSVITLVLPVLGQEGSAILVDTGAILFV